MSHKAATHEGPRCPWEGFGNLLAPARLQPVPKRCASPPILSALLPGAEFRSRSELP